MKKRILCALLTLVMLVSLVPVAALTANAASHSTSESAITVLKQLEGYSTTCNAQGYTGYGTKCTKTGTHGAHKTTEKQADVALREALADLDSAINSFATKNGLALTQSQHDALVLFSFENGTAWTTGTGDFKAAVVNKLSGNDFLNAICRWDASLDDDNRRMVEANMYLNGVYSSTRPSSFIRVYYYPNYNVYTLPLDGQLEVYAGDINEATTYQYYDVSQKTAPHLTPTMDYHTFTGWYIYTEYGWTKVTNLTSDCHNRYLVAGWVMNYSTPGDTSVSYVVNSSQLLSQKVYKYDTTKAAFEAVEKISASNYYFTDYALWVDSDYLAEDGTRYCRIQNTEYWVKVSGGTASASTSSGVDLTVTVTNTYVNRRAAADIYAAKNGTYNYGAQLRIIGTPVSSRGFLWGQVAESATSNTPVGWVALMYTNYETVKNQTTAATTVNTSSAIAKAVITYNGYVNVRKDAGTDNQFVGALPNGAEVDLYETKYVNGLEWGRCNTGWFCLAYANVTRLTTNTSYTTDVGYISYAFTGNVDPSSVEIYKEPSLSADRIFTRQYIDPKVTVTNLTQADGYTWGKISEGWIRVSDANGEAVDAVLDVTTFTVSADSLTVRQSASTASSRVDTLSKGVEFNVNQTKQIVVVGESVWGYADKVGEDNKTYGGWVNLATKYVQRNNAPVITTTTTTTATPTGKIATIVGADSVRVRKSCAIYGDVLGSISRGTAVNILGESNGWYKIDYDVDNNPETDSWVYSGYVSVSEGTIDNSTASSTEGTGVGIISNTYGGVNVRSNPGVGSALRGKILPGTQVNILEVKTYGTSKWGRVEEGWICMDYVTIISDLPADVLASITGSDTTNNNTANGSTSTAEVAIYTGTVKQDVNVRKEPSLNADVVRELKQGENFTMHEIVTVVEDVTTTTNDTNTGATTTTVKQTSYWARVNDGYIYNPGDHLSLDTLDEATYTITGSDKLNVRDNPGTDGTNVQFKLRKGDQVAVTKLQIVNGNVWGYVECDDGEGWASLAYMTKGAVSVVEETVPVTTAPVETTPVVGSTGSSTTANNTSSGTYKYTGKVINTNSLNVRSQPSTGAAKSGTLKNGASLKIYETCISDAMAWGRCDDGWVYLYYVDLTPVSGAIDARVVYNDNTIIYTDASCSGTTGSTYAKMAVIDILETSGDMVRTELGWVSRFNLL